MKLSQILSVKLVLLFILNSCNGFRYNLLAENLQTNLQTSILVSSLSIFALNAPGAYSFPFDFLFRGRAEKTEETTATLRPRPPSNNFPSKSRYFDMASNLLNWAFNVLDDDSEESEKRKKRPGRHDADDDSMAESSEEDEPQLPSLNTLQDKIAFLRKGRLGTIGRNTDLFPPPQRRSDRKKRPQVEPEDKIESASVNELKEMLNQLKREDEGFLSSFSMPVVGPILSFGTSMFKKVYCGFSSNSYCAEEGPTSSFFDSFKRSF